MTKDDLMLLPPPNHHGGTYESSPFNYYTDDQMREYANLAVIAERESLVDAIETANARSKMRLPDIIVLILSRSQS
jgi:hypothetical protein